MQLDPTLDSKTIKSLLNNKMDSTSYTQYMKAHQDRWHKHIPKQYHIHPRQIFANIITDSHWCVIVQLHLAIGNPQQLEILRIYWTFSCHHLVYPFIQHILFCLLCPIAFSHVFCTSISSRLFSTLVLSYFLAFYSYSFSNNTFSLFIVFFPHAFM